MVKVTRGEEGKSTIIANSRGGREVEDKCKSRINASRRVNTFRKIRQVKNRPHLRFGKSRTVPA